MPIPFYLNIRTVQAQKGEGWPIWTCLGKVKRNQKLLSHMPTFQHYSYTSHKEVFILGFRSIEHIENAAPIQTNSMESSHTSNENVVRKQ